MTLVETLAATNACLNSASAIFAISGWVVIKRRRMPGMKLHRALMWSAFVSSCLFLVSYVTRFALSGDTHFSGGGAVRYVYFALLASHVLLAIAIVPLVLRTLYLALRKRFEQHRRIARWTLPLWTYVSVTGVIVYLMLYHWPWPAT